MEPSLSQRQCKRCTLWKHNSRFRHRVRQTRYHSLLGGTAIQFDSVCLDCQQKERNEKKNADRPLAIIEERARKQATKLGVSFDYVWTDLNWKSLVAPLRAALGPDGICQACGEKYVNERDIQIEHLFPPRDDRFPDFAREQAGNIRLGCGSCNRRKARKALDEWLDANEVARITNSAERTSTDSPQQPSLF